MHSPLCYSCLWCDLRVARMGNGRYSVCLGLREIYRRIHSCDLRDFYVFLCLAQFLDHHRTSIVERRYTDITYSDGENVNLSVGDRNRNLSLSLLKIPKCRSRRCTSIPRQPDSLNFENYPLIIQNSWRDLRQIGRRRGARNHWKMIFSRSGGIYGSFCIIFLSARSN